MKGIKRPVRRFGRVLGHSRGLEADGLLGYREARFQIFLPSYLWVLENALRVEVGELRRMAASQTVVLLDYETNADVEDLSRPLSHAALIVRYIEGSWPSSVS